DLVDVAINMVREEREAEVEEIAEQRVEERLLDLLLPPVPEVGRTAPAATGPGAEPQQTIGRAFIVGPAGEVEERKLTDAGAADDPDWQRVQERRERTREKLRTLLRDGKLEEGPVDREGQKTTPSENQTH